MDAAHSQKAPRHAGDAPDLTVTSGEPRSLTDAPQAPLTCDGPDQPATSRAFASTGSAISTQSRFPKYAPKLRRLRRKRLVIAPLGVVCKTVGAVGGGISRLSRDELHFARSVCALRFVRTIWTSLKGARSAPGARLAADRGKRRAQAALTRVRRSSRPSPRQASQGKVARRGAARRSSALPGHGGVGARPVPRGPRTGLSAAMISARRAGCKSGPSPARVERLSEGWPGLDVGENRRGTDILLIQSGPCVQAGDDPTAWV